MFKNFICVPSSGFLLPLPKQIGPCPLLQKKILFTVRLCPAIPLALLERAVANHTRQVFIKTEEAWPKAIKTFLYDVINNLYI